MRRHLLVVVLPLIAAQALAADVVGRWDLTVGKPPHTRPSWLKVEKQDGIATDFVYDPPGNLLKMTITFQPEFLTTLLVDETIRLEFGLDGAASATLVCKICNGH